MNYFLRVGIAFDQLANAVANGFPDEVFSSRCYRWAQSTKWYYKVPYYVVNGIFFWQKNHCKMAYESEQQRKHMPPELRWK